MLSHSANYLRVSIDNIYQAAHYPSYLLLVVLNVAIPYLAWRIWRFSIVPTLYPQVPKDLPYWCPGMTAMNPVEHY